MPSAEHDFYLDAARMFGYSDAQASDFKIYYQQISETSLQEWLVLPGGGMFKWIYNNSSADIQFQQGNTLYTSVDSGGTILGYVTSDGKTNITQSNLRSVFGSTRATEFLSYKVSFGIGDGVHPEVQLSELLSAFSYSNNFQRTGLGFIPPDPASFDRPIEDRTLDFIPLFQAARIASAGSRAFMPGVTGVPVTANFAQTTFREAFSARGAAEVTKIVGKPINTIDDLVVAIKSGAVDASKVPVNYIQRGGNITILDTRTAQALERAGIPRSAWNGRNVSGDPFFEQRLTNQLTGPRNQLSPSGTPAVFPGP